MRFRKSVKVMPGVRLNLSKSGVSTSFGGRGGTINVSKRGVRSTLSVPGTGLSWSSTSGWSESRPSRPAEEVERLGGAAEKAVDTVAKEADKVSALADRIDRAIEALTSGRGVTQSKVQTFEKRVLAEEQKLTHIEEKIRERRLFLDAIVARLRGLQFGLFAGGDKARRDRVAQFVSQNSQAIRGIESQLAEQSRLLAEKLSEVQDMLDDEGKGS